MGQGSPTANREIKQEVFAMLPIAIQLYSVRDDAAADMRGTLQKIREMGYDGVEFAGLHGHTAEAPGGTRAV